ncbi:MAG TPA: DMT family transporter [Burkholderiaceae bacterium]|nr:DMT family transporter [Burkholderiaceae bacterium]
MWLAALLLVAVAVGAAVPMQSAINAQMAQAQGHPLYGALANTLIASAVLASLVLGLRVPAPNLRAAVAGPWWLWAGGVIGAAFVFGALSVAPRIGAAAFAAATIFGSAVAALAIDHWGWFGFAERPLDASRLAGAACLLVGVALLQGGRA